MDFLKWVLCAVIGYALGNFSTGLIVAKQFAHIDIRNHGSGNAGSTNVLRTLGWLPSVLTLLGDVLKGVLGAVIGYLIMGDSGARLGGLCAVIGHNWPIAFGFKGGKGIATSLGAIIVIEPWFALALLVFEITVIYAGRMVSVASIAAGVLYPLMTIIFRHQHWDWCLYAVIMGALAIFSHRANIKRLLHGEESRLDFKKISKLDKHGKNAAK
jgi:glycerol-3-phosphate acyltransferase PlsY